MRPSDETLRRIARCDGSYKTATISDALLGDIARELLERRANVKAALVAVQALVAALQKDSA